MKLNLTNILLALFLIVASAINKNLEIVSIALFLAFTFVDMFLIKNKLNTNVKNLVYGLIALSVYPNLLFLFMIYLPFSIFGVILENRNFIKSYILGFAISIIPTLLVYVLSVYFGLTLSAFTIALFFYSPIIMGIVLITRNKKGLDFLDFDSKSIMSFLVILVCTLYIASNIVVNDALFMSNGTYMYSKFKLITKTIDSYQEFPIYDPGTSSGESPFLFEAPLFFSHLAFANSLLSFIPSIEFYNLYSFFVLFIATLSLTLLIRSVIGLKERVSFTNSVVILVIALSIGLNFRFLQFLEAFKEFFTFPINYLIFALLLEKPTKVKDMFMIFFMIMLSFILHAPHGVGLILISSSLVFIMLMKGFFSGKGKEVIRWITTNKKIFLLGIPIILFPLFYVGPTFVFEEFLEDKREFDPARIKITFPNYYKDFMTDTELSLKYPDVRRNDDKKIGPVISIFGLLSVFLAILLFRIKRLSNLRLFIGAYAIHFFISSIITVHPMIGSLEYGYRTAFPYFFILLASSIAALVSLIGQKQIKILAIVLLAVGFLHTVPFAKQNIENIHREQIASGDVMSSEIALIKSLPNDGRVITYGLFSNAVDPAMSMLTDKYFSRSHLTEVARSRTIYWKIHGTNSFGQETFVMNKTGIEFYNYLKSGGYKYVLANVCHPVGNFLGQQIYPDYSGVLYQNNCLVVFNINKTNYAEKVSIVPEVDDEVYSEKGGYKYLTLSEHFDFGKDIAYDEDVTEPEKLDFNRIRPTEVEIYGNFERNDWVVFKEDYFSRWKAYMDGNEIPILASNHNHLLLNTDKGTRILLRYDVLGIEKVLGFISLIASIALLIIMLIFASRKH